jgi:hypothetical protein
MDATALAKPHDFQRTFDARKYLEHYWPVDVLDSECQFILTFMHDTYSKHKDRVMGKTLFEFSGGPIVDKYLSASRYVGKIYHSAHTPQSRAEIERITRRSEDRYDWYKRFEFVEGLEQSGGGKKGAETSRVEERLCSKLSGSVLGCDADLPFGGVSDEGLRDEIGILSINSVIECISTSKEDFVAKLHRVLDILRPGGMLVMTLNVETTYWEGGNGIKYPAVYTTEEEIVRVLASRGFVDIETRVFTSSEEGTESEMDKTIALSAWLGD